MMQIPTPNAKPSQAKPSQAKPSQAKPSQAKPSQAKPSQDKPSQDKTRQDKTRQDKTRHSGFNLVFKGGALLGLCLFMDGVAFPVQRVLWVVVFSHLTLWVVLLYHPFFVDKDILLA